MQLHSNDINGRSTSQKVGEGDEKEGDIPRYVGLRWAKSQEVSPRGGDITGDETLMTPVPDLRLLKAISTRFAIKLYPMFVTD